MNKKSRVLVIEDESDIRELMAMHLRREGYESVGAEDGEEGLRLFANGHYDLAILDWMLPGVSGLELCRRFAGKLPILMVTARADAADVIAGLEAGADDYVTKPFEIAVFLARVRALLRRSEATFKQPASGWYLAGELRANIDEHAAWCGGEKIKLTLSEFRLLAALLENKGRVLSRTKLIDMVQGSDITVTDRTIDTHVFGLRKKLGACASLIETIRGVGYRIVDE